jgi:hypothetical protein
MSRTQFAVTLAVVAVAGCLGGSMTDWLRPTPAHAQRGTRQVIRARLLEIVDEAGKVRVSLGVGPQSAGIAINDEEGRPRLGLTYQSDGRSMIGLGGEDEVTRMILAHNAAHGQSGIQIRNNAGEACIDIGETPNGPGVLLYNQPGKARITLKACPGETAGLQILDEAGMERIELSESPAVGTRLTFADEAGQNRVTINSEGSKGATGIAIADQDERPRIGLVHAPGRGAGISVWDEEGTEKQLAP